MHTTTTTPATTPYPRLPELAPRLAGETAEQYGLRALLFITAERLTATVDTEGLDLAAHVFRLAVCNAALTTVGAERLADVGRMITGDRARRQAAEQALQATVHATIAPAGEEKPRQGPGAPLTPAPKPQTPPGAATRPAGVVRVGRSVPPAAPVVTGPAAIPARHTAVSPALATRTTLTDAELF